MVGPHGCVGSREWPVVSMVMASGQEGWPAPGGTWEGSGGPHCQLGCLGPMGRAGGATKGPEPGFRRGVGARVLMVFGFGYNHLQARGRGGAQVSAAGTVVSQPCSGSEGAYLHRPTPPSHRLLVACRRLVAPWAALLGPLLTCSAVMVLPLANELVSAQPEPCAPLCRS